jgi:hypothetical protein
MKASKLLTICLLVIISTQAWGSRLYWLQNTGPGSLSFWQNKNLPNSQNLCRNGLGMGSKLYWESCSYDPANPSVLLPGTKANWEKGFGPGTKSYWNTAITPFNGMTTAQMCTSPYGYRPGMKLYYTLCTGPGSRAYWESGTERGSSIYWKAGTGRSVAADWVGPCMDTELDVAWCKQMKKDVLLQNTSVLDWSSSLVPVANEMSCSIHTGINPAQQDSLQNVLSTAQAISNFVNQTSAIQTDDHR